ncbi:MAG TPA: ribosome biogenesis GTP-binding protein YihA/YsxC [Syntrophorhabdaceae bacterium]|jgi:GTP-binding protein
MKILNAEYMKGVTRPDETADETVPEVSFIGRSNVGKSSMINRLVMRKVAKTSSTPGATRIINLYKVLYELGGGRKSMIFSDFPGFGYAKVSKEMYKGWESMIGGYIAESRRIRDLIWVYDVRRDIDDLDKALIDWVFSLELEFSVVLTKIDKETRSNVMKKKMLFSRYFGESRVLTFSAKDGYGRKELLSHIVAEH